jgi:hypothetical protein
MQQDEKIWHKCRCPIIPKRTVDGGWTTWLGQTWRRRQGSDWEYSQDPQPYEKWAEEQW